MFQISEESVDKLIHKLVNLITRAKGSLELFEKKWKEYQEEVNKTFAFHKRQIENLERDMMGMRTEILTYIENNKNDTHKQQ